MENNNPIISTPGEERLTDSQFRALHLWFKMLAETLRADGHDMRKSLDYPILPTPTSVKEMIFKPILLATFGKKSTKELAKQKEIDDCFDIINKLFGEMGIVIPPFPSLETLLLEEEAKKRKY